MNIVGGVFHKGALLPLFFAEHKKSASFYGTGCTYDLFEEIRLAIDAAVYSRSNSFSRCMLREPFIRIKRSRNGCDSKWEYRASTSAKWEKTGDV